MLPATRPKPRHPQLGEPTAVYEYERASGDLAFVVCRFEPKDFRPAQWRSERWSWDLKGAPVVPYRFPDIELALTTGRTIWIVDGEKDANALAALGEHATCCARSQNWTPELADLLGGAAHVNIVADLDGGTGLKQALEVQELLVSAGVSRENTEILMSADGKDAYDHLQAGLSLDDFARYDPIPSTSLNGNAPTETREWLIDAADLLAQPDPGPTPWLVQDMIVDGAIIAAVGRWKTTKSYGLLDLCISIASGEPAFGVHEIPEPGTVIFANEESGRTALWRRLDSLCRGRALDPERLRGRLLLGANAQIKLDSESWQNELVELGKRLSPRLFVFDPLARMKDAGREENAQKDMAPLIEFIRTLRHETGAAVCFVHHTGHMGEQMRGSSDLESFWETRLTWKRDGQSPTVTITSEHREAESSEPVSYQIRFDPELRTMRFATVEPDGTPPLAVRILAALEMSEDDGLTTDEVRSIVNVRRSDVARTLEIMEVAGTTHRGPSQRRDGMGRPTTAKVWKPGSQAENRLDLGHPDNRTTQDDPVGNAGAPSRRPTTLRWDGTDDPPDGPSRTEQPPFDSTYFDGLEDDDLTP